MKLVKFGNKQYLIIKTKANIFGEDIDVEIISDITNIDKNKQLQTQKGLSYIFNKVFTLSKKKNYWWKFWKSK